MDFEVITLYNFNKISEKISLTICGFYIMYIQSFKNIAACSNFSTRPPWPGRKKYLNTNVESELYCQYVRFIVIIMYIQVQYTILYYMISVYAIYNILYIYIYILESIYIYIYIYIYMYRYRICITSIQTNYKLTQRLHWSAPHGL